MTELFKLGETTLLQAGHICRIRSNPNTLKITTMTDKRRAWLTIATIWGLLLVIAAIRPLSLPDEGRYGDISRWMFISGDWLIPRLNGIPFFHKPPLLYWLQAEVFRFAGVHVWTARLVIASHALLMLICLYLGMKQISSEAIAQRVIIVLGTSAGFLIGGQYINHDFLVATWITIAIGLFALTFKSPERLNLTLARLGFFACGLGFLSKGLIGIVLPGLVILIWLIVIGQTRRLLQLPWFSGTLMLCCVALPWIAQVQDSFSGFSKYFIIDQHFSRFTGSHFNSQQPWWFYLPIIAIYMFPWFFLFIWGFANHVKTGFTFIKFRQISINPWAALPWIWLFVILLFFSIPKSKLMGYILPVIPPMAILIVTHWDRLTANKKSAEFWFWCICGFSASTAVGANFLARHNSLKDTSLDTAHVLNCLLQPGDHVYVAGAYPYDLPFEINRQEPLLIIQDWADARKNAADDWRRIFFEGADFDPAAGHVLQNEESLQAVLPNGKSWLVAPAEFQLQANPHPWHVIFKGRSWALWRAGVSSNENVPGNGNSAQSACLGNARLLP